MSWWAAEECSLGEGSDGILAGEILDGDGVGKKGEVLGRDGKAVF